MPGHIPPYPLCSPLPAPRMHLRNKPPIFQSCSSITGKEIDADDAPGIGQQALASIASVVSRDATPVIPVQASEISRVLAKRLFTKIVESVAKETADLYREMYRKIKDKGLKPVDITSDFI